MKTDVTSKKARGKVNIYHNYKRGTCRLRFNSAHAEQLEIVQTALSKARIESNTEYDTVALTNICLHYLSDK